MAGTAEQYEGGALGMKRGKPENDVTAIVLCYVILGSLLVIGGLLGFLGKPDLAGAPPPRGQAATPLAAAAGSHTTGIPVALSARTDVPRKDGIAVALLIDSSGSMADSVQETDGTARPKMEIAKRCVLDIVNTPVTPA
jgi:hypothetical protein